MRVGRYVMYYLMLSMEGNSGYNLDDVTVGCACWGKESLYTVASKGQENGEKLCNNTMLSTMTMSMF